MKKHRIIYVSVLIVFNLILLSGCSTGRNLIRDNTVTVERIDTNITYIKSVSVQQFDKEISIKGTVQRQHSGRGTVRGHVDLELITPNGRLIYQDEVPYYRKNLKKGEANFQITLPEEPQAGSVLRLSLHNVPAPAVH